MRETFQYLLLGHLLIAGVASACVPFQCLICNSTEMTRAGACPSCNTSCIPDEQYANISSSCKKGVQVFANRTGSNVDEGKDVKLKCVHDLKGQVWLLGWKMDGEEILDKRNKSKIRLKKVLAHKSGKYSCFVNSTCGFLESEPHDVTVKNNSVILLIVCGISALALVVTMGLVLKYKMKRDSAKHRERMEMRAQEGRPGGPDPIGPRV
ncbi:uncharacterized protein LOC118111878 [Hippoglossus stenolepis]|uniref:uncharacterized protein LOC118111878 n=1 Tax=Hippoglossus stenolepis TaxID=195615 RepID=UPI001FAFC711|nr:uncharacterized protein LOC118111878 [Hippoglossus stenolepis]